MANQEHLALLQQGVDQWNYWREQHPDIRPDLSRAHLSSADLSFAHLSSADLSFADLSRANLIGAYFSRANLSFANLIGADLSHANLIGADLSFAHLSHAHLSDADLSRTNLSDAGLSFARLSRAHLSSADLSRAHLSSADLSRANLSHANLSRANLSDADLSDADLSDADLSDADLSRANLNSATIGYTSLGDRDLREVKGLETIQHKGPSPLSINTIYLSEGDIPEGFVRGTGAPDGFIEYMHALASKPIQYYTCFISYSSQDDAFAKRLYNDLQGKGVRCWFAPHDMRIGDDIRQRIDESIRVYDKLLLVLSCNSLTSTWVQDEVEAAFEKEQQHSKLVLFPITLDETIKQTDRAWAAKLRRARHIGNFTQWKNYQDYQTSFTRLLRDLNLGGM